MQRREFFRERSSRFTPMHVAQRQLVDAYFGRMNRLMLDAGGALDFAASPPTANTRASCSSLSTWAGLRKKGAGRLFFGSDASDGRFAAFEVGVSVGVRVRKRPVV